MRNQAFPKEDVLVGCWDELGAGAPTVVALAMLASQALARADQEERKPRLSVEAKAILSASLPRGLLEIKAINTAFETPERLLAVHVEMEPERWLVFRDRRDPRYTIRGFSSTLLGRTCHASPLSRVFPVKSRFSVGRRLVR
jgi:hypothetical protein